MFKNQSRLEQIDAKIRAFDRLYGDQIAHLGRECIHGVDHAFLDPMRCQDCKQSYVRFCNENNIPVGKTVELINYESSPDQTLWQRIKAQPIVIKRLFVLLSILWVMFETFIDFKVLTWDRYDYHWHLNNYIVSAYMPIVIIYGIYWIISGIKKA